MRTPVGLAASFIVLALAGCTQHEPAPPPRQVNAPAPAPLMPDPQLQRIEHIVVIYAENRSFDNLYGTFPGADGVANARPEQYLQRNRDGTELPLLPYVWSTPKGPNEKPTADMLFARGLPNEPFRIDARNRANLPLGRPTRDLVHRFYQHQEQINGGKLDYFAAVSDAGGLTMGYYDGSPQKMWAIAKEYTLADHFFMGAFGGSFLNHFWLICACTPQYSNDDAKVYASMLSALDVNGRLLRAPNSPVSAMAGPPIYQADRAVTPDGFAVNTLQPPYQPSGVAAPANNPNLADERAHPLPPQNAPTIGDRLNDAHITWAWYAGAWSSALDDGARPVSARRVIYNDSKGAPNFQPHHQPFNYFARYAPGTAARTQHLKDALEFHEAIARGTLPAVSFYKPQGSLNQHPGYTDVLSGDAHIASVIAELQASPIWGSTVVIVTYDENGGFWDHVPPPQGDRWGPGSRIPTIIVSPFARRHYIDSSVYDTTSIIKLISRRFGLTPLPGVRANAGDLTGALDLVLTAVTSATTPGALNGPPVGAMAR